MFGFWKRKVDEGIEDGSHEDAGVTLQETVRKRNSVRGNTKRGTQAGAGTKVEEILIRPGSAEHQGLQGMDAQTHTTVSGLSPRMSARKSAPAKIYVEPLEERNLEDSKLQTQVAEMNVEIGKRATEEEAALDDKRRGTQRQAPDWSSSSKAKVDEKEFIAGPRSGIHVFTSTAPESPMEEPEGQRRIFRLKQVKQDKPKQKDKATQSELLSPSSYYFIPVRKGSSSGKVSGYSSTSKDSYQGSNRGSISYVSPIRKSIHLHPGLRCGLNSNGHCGWHYGGQYSARSNPCRAMQSCSFHCKCHCHPVVQHPFAVSCAITCDSVCPSRVMLLKHMPTYETCLVEEICVPGCGTLTREETEESHKTHTVKGKYSGRKGPQRNHWKQKH